MKVFISDLTVKSIIKLREKAQEDIMPNVLYPYAYHCTENNNYELFELMDVKGNGLYEMLMVDSGVYVLNTLYKKGKLVDFSYKKHAEIYSNFIKEYRDSFDYYANYDCCFDEDIAFEVNKQYQKMLERNGLNPIYIMHTLSQEEIDFVLNNGYEYIGISSAMLSKSNEFKEANNLVTELYNKNIRVHLYGCGSFNKLSNTYAWSCDASSYVRWASLNQIIFCTDILDNKGIAVEKEKTLCLSEYNKKGELNKSYYKLLENKQYADKYEDFIYEGLGLTLDDIVGDCTGQNLVLANAYYMYTLEQKVDAIQKNKGITFPWV